MNSSAYHERHPGEPMTSPETSRKDIERPRDREVERNLILVVVFFVICLIGFFTFVTAEANGEPVQEVSEKKAFRPEFTPPVAKPTPLPLPLETASIEQIEKEWGIRIISLSITAGGYMMDFRFEVVDESKSKIFFDHRIKPKLVVEKSNAVLPVPMAAKVGAFRPTDRGGNIKAGKIYYIVFGNPDSHVKSGDKVTMVFGDFKAEGMTVH